ncbi:histone deacetylase family protein [Salinarimonas ramus]|uniref:Acetylpolyamine amidohydrolase n=1 Tax=Salinarimonas ramus TaxID=690164 RepID=A0A917Q5I3_9HYPH|nr:histone deacetylase family protein [Salinarimonas ramus]GGK24046.1 acetylpolyamine amidohydrolase [Salinarimonas ramus]
MRAFHDARALAHDPDSYFRRGTIVAHPEQGERWTLLRDAIADAHDLVAPADHGEAPILAVHDAAYVRFLREAWSRRGELPGGADAAEILSGHFARPHMSRRPEGMLGLIGYHTADTSTPIRPGTWEAVHAAAQVAVSAADAALEDGRAYALCRPPGHHAYADSAGGFCFLNNSAIAAERLRTRHSRVAVLDIDVHHGNGTQGVFYTRGDILTISIHADPADYFPYYAGYADEVGVGDGEGANRNIPLPHGSGDAPWLAAIEDALEGIARFAPGALVVALGLDASKDDPIGALAVTTDGFARAAETIARAGLPTAIVQEGGYLCEALPRNLRAVLDAYDAACG